MRFISLLAVVCGVLFVSSAAFAGGGGAGPAPVDPLSKLKLEVHQIHGAITALQTQVKALKGQVGELQKENVGLKTQLATLQTQVAGNQIAADFTKTLMGLVQIAPDSGPSGMDRVTFTGPLEFAYPSVIVKLSLSKSPPYATSLTDFIIGTGWNFSALSQEIGNLWSAVEKLGWDSEWMKAYVMKLMNAIQIQTAEETASGKTELTIYASVKVFGDLYANFFGDLQALLAGEEPKSDVCEMVWCTGQPGICNTISIGSGQSFVDMVTAEEVFTCVDGAMTAQFISPETNLCQDGVKIGMTLFPMGSLTDKKSGETFLNCP